jgi:myo-inositol catabolism protein IolH
MKLALDPYMFRRLPLEQIPRLAADVGFPCLELSPRDDFLPLFAPPVARKEQCEALNRTLREAGVELVSVMLVYRWSSVDDAEREAALDRWRTAIEVALRLECAVINTEFSVSPAAPQGSEAAFLRSVESLAPLMERNGIRIDIEPHPGDFVEDGNCAVDLIARIASPHFRYLYCVPHTFHMGEDAGAMIRYAAPYLTHVHLADTLNHRKGLRYIVNPPGAQVRVHQHLNIGQGEIDWDAVFGALPAVGFDGILTNCVFAWEDRAQESTRQMRHTIGEYLRRYPLRRSEAAPGG